MGTDSSLSTAHVGKEADVVAIGTPSSHDQIAVILLNQPRLNQSFYVQFKIPSRISVLPAM